MMLTTPAPLLVDELVTNARLAKKVRLSRGFDFPPPPPHETHPAVAIKTNKIPVFFKKTPLEVDETGGGYDDKIITKGGQRHSACSLRAGTIDIMSSPFLERLRRAPMLCDGAMGTLLYGQGIFINRCYDELNLSQPETIRGIHRDYVQAGAEIIETNTFGANSFR